MNDNQISFLYCLAVIGSIIGIVSVMTCVIALVEIAHAVRHIH